MTGKILKQVRDAEEHAIVEGVSHTVSCFLWQPSSEFKQEGAKYRIQEFRASDVLQRQQSMAAGLIPVTEADELDENASRADLLRQSTLMKDNLQSFASAEPVPQPFSESPVEV